MNSSVTINGKNYRRKLIKTRLLNFGDDVPTILKEYVLPQKENGDWLAISEKIVSVCQNNVRHISTVKAGRLAKFIVQGVKKYPDDIGFSLPEKMQLVVEISGTIRTLLAIVFGALGKIFGIRGLFWMIVGNRVSEIDGFNPDAMYPYTEYAILPPHNPEKVCEGIEKLFGLPAMIIDGNNINVKIIAQSSGVPVDAKTARLILLDNPMGQDAEMTPFVLVNNNQ